MNRFKCLTNGEYSFINCQWQGSTHESHGSCIYLVNSSSELSVEKCSFSDCETKTGCGGAVYGYNINKVHIYDSSFLRCNILSTSNDEYGGGGIYLEYIHTEVLIKSSSFLDSSAPYDAGGVDMWNCDSQLNNQNTFQDFMFIKCKGTLSEGGGILAWNNTYNVGITNTLFAECSNIYGGGFKMNLHSSPPSEFILFCFFTRNTADENFGNDVCIRTEIFKSPFLHSFTTFLANSVACYSESASAYKKKDDWLPLGDMLLRFESLNYTTYVNAIVSIPRQFFTPQTLSTASYVQD